MVATVLLLLFVLLGAVAAVWLTVMFFGLGRMSRQLKQEAEREKRGG